MPDKRETKSVKDLVIKVPNGCNGEDSLNCLVAEIIKNEGSKLNGSRYSTDYCIGCQRRVPITDISQPTG